MQLQPNKEVMTMTEQQKFAALYEKLSPEKKAVFIAMMQTMFAMVTAMVANEQKGVTK